MTMTTAIRVPDIDINDIESMNDAVNSQYSLHGVYVCLLFSHNLHILEYDVFFCYASFS